MLVAIRSVEGKRTPKMMRWGLLPHWAKDEKILTRRSMREPRNSRRSQRSGMPGKRGQRCLVVTDGFYEWKKLDEKGKDKQSYAIDMADDGQMVLAGLWAKWKDPKSGDEIQSCTILTCGPNDAMAKLHDRMPGHFR